jgi:chondroitin 4-sulfotransferase 11
MILGDNFIFVHPPKTGGQSIEKVLEPLPSATEVFDQHSTLFEAFKIYRIGFENKFKFGFVRNPYDREVSNYFWHAKTNDKVNCDNFNDWIKWKYEESTGVLQYDDFKDEETYWYLKGFGKNPQVGFFVDPVGDWLADFVGRFETINEDWKFICNKMGWSFELPHIGYSEVRKKDYKEYYNEKSYDIVTEWYKQDLEIFGYNFFDGLERKEINYDYPIDIHLHGAYNYYYG